MIENIALIKEVHLLLSTPKAQEEAQEYLKKIGLESIATNRLTACSAVEIFYVQLIRALMTQEKNIIIVSPFSLIDNLRNINDIIENIKLLNQDRNILILDTQNNEIHYKGYACNIVK